jgi:hypothetical protein
MRKKKKEYKWQIGKPAYMSFFSKNSIWKDMPSSENSQNQI